MRKVTFLLLALSVTTFGQVGIGTTTPNATLEIVATNPTGASTGVDGIIIPNVDRQRAQNMTGASASTLIYVNNITTGTATGSAVNITSNGFYFYDGSVWQRINTGVNTNWSLNGNSGTNGGNTTTAGTNFIGTTDAQNIDIRTNNVYRGRFSSLGEFFLGTLNTATAGDLQSAVGNTTFPWAVNGYTANNGGGIYGSITSGTSPYGSVQGEYYGTSMFGTGITGLTSNTTSGTDFLGNTASAVYGALNNSTNRTFGVFGDTFNNIAIRTGGVLGTDGVRAGSLGYYSSASVSYAVYGFGTAYQTGAAAGRMSNMNQINASIGLGIYGGVIGGWIKGDEYGTVFTGKRFSSYNLGKVISNEDYIVISGKENKTVSYASTSLQPEINSKGVAKLINGAAQVNFEESFYNLIDKSKPIIVTCTPMGETKGIFLTEVTPKGFKIKENQKGTSSVSFSWIAIGEKDISENQKISDEILDPNFENNLNGVMHDENLEGGKAIWSENGTVYFGDSAPVSTEKKKERTKRSRINPKQNNKSN